MKLLLSLVSFFFAPIALRDGVCAPPAADCALLAAPVAWDAAGFAAELAVFCAVDLCHEVVSNGIRSVEIQRVRNTGLPTLRFLLWQAGLLAF